MTNIDTRAKVVSLSNKDKNVTTVIEFGDIVEENGKTIRENRMKLKHNIPLDSLVEVEVTVHFVDNTSITGRVKMYVVTHGRDCDGTPLYGLSNYSISGMLEYADPEKIARISSRLMERIATADERTVRLHNIFRVDFGYSEDSLTIVK